MKIKIIIETWNDKWRFEIEDKEFGDRVKSGERETFTACAADCLAFVAENAAQPLRAVDVAESCQNCKTAWKFHDPRVCSMQPPRN